MLVAPNRTTYRLFSSYTSPGTMNQKITGFHQDSEGIWMADLACRHTQHIRHNPPWQERPWVLTESGRQDKLGAELDCFFCNMATIPADAKPYKQTARFDETTVPAGLLADHRLKPGVWGQIVVEEGHLEYTCDRGVFVLRPDVVGIVEPEVVHYVRLQGPVRFYVEFLKLPEGGNAELE
jgi:tellurite methyltransferase